MLTKFIIVCKVAWRNRCDIRRPTLQLINCNLVRVCTQKAQHDLRFEENIDAFSMGGGQQGRTSGEDGQGVLDFRSSFWSSFMLIA